MRYYGVVYNLTHRDSDRCYIGQTSRSFAERMGEYKRLECIGQTKIYRAIHKYGWQAFDSEVIYQATSQLELNDLEWYYINIIFNSIKYGYNLTSGGSVERPSEETLRKQSKIKKGNKNPMFGKKHSESTKIKMSLASRGKIKPELHVQKMRLGSRYRMKAVFCDNIIYESVQCAALKLKIHPGHIAESLVGKRKKKYESLRYAAPEETEQAIKK